VSVADAGHGAKTVWRKVRERRSQGKAARQPNSPVTVRPDSPFAELAALIRK